MLGISLDSQAFRDHLDRIHPPDQRFPCSTKTFPGTLFHNYTTLGISYSFDEKQTGGDLVLAAIHLYNDGISGYSRYALEDVFPLPYGLRMDLTGQEIVALLDEPTSKEKYPKCCVVYDNLGIQIDLAAKDWEDPNCKIECFTVYST
ncbi:uncharacterized protein EV422DRAFT_563611 [Fimicolochytrium jonesii]|uniref:uncharacterized protein n=1 Tax=Fimicolochytrium jonesii TaxID=1396493 RepID=UPI0022FDF722|nr:uncharacterized protein EV422DRAFT_563611 [Fimicolochytrium jonesii]KAI8825778.1 hypothetical protein EV422DRAFT_563611 [Fimicolochytrium jonesii]